MSFHFSNVTLVDCHTDTTEPLGKKYDFLEDKAENDPEFRGQDTMEEFDLTDPDGPEDFTMDVDEFETDAEYLAYGLKTVTDWITAEEGAVEPPHACWVLHYLAWEKNVLPRIHTVVHYWW